MPENTDVFSAHRIPFCAIYSIVEAILTRAAHLPADLSPLFTLTSDFGLPPTLHHFGVTFSRRFL
jgi:hypothetical protein